MINNVVLVGRMTRDAELRYTPSNVAVATFTLAVNRTFKSQNGEREADFINVVTRFVIIFPFSFLFFMANHFYIVPIWVNHKSSVVNRLLTAITRSSIVSPTCL